MGLTAEKGYYMLFILVTMHYQTVVETPEFIKQANLCMDEESREAFIDYIAKNPLAGELIPRTGGARKIRWTSDSNQGKRGGSRVIYYFHDEIMPIFLFTAYAKSQKDNLTASEENALKFIIKQLVASYKRSS